MALFLFPFLHNYMDLTGSGKTIAARMYVSHLIQQGKKVVALDGLNELRQYSSLLGGESIEYDKIQQSQFNSPLTNILLPRDEILIEDSVVDVLKNLILHSSLQDINYIFIDHLDGELSQQNATRRYELFSQLNERNIKIILVTQMIYENDKKPFLEIFNNILYFGNTNYYTELKDIRLPRTNLKNDETVLVNFKKGDYKYIR